jgi:mevalonate kinase
MVFSMRTNGKLLLTGEYFVTEGAVALTLPTRLGQKIEVTAASSDTTPRLNWKSYTKDGEIWFEANYSLPALQIDSSSGGEDKEAIAETLQNALQQAQKMNPDFLSTTNSLDVKCILEFDLNWGLGSSSTLITMLATWAKVDPFELLQETFGGSGYDIVAATAEGPMLFQKFNGKNRWESSGFDPSFKDQLYFVYLGKKQNTREAVVHYMITAPEEREKPLPRITQITYDIAQYTDNLEDFDTLIEEHETLVQGIIKQPKAKELYFSDYWGSVKSLGGWGGDFVLVTSHKSKAETTEYFVKKGFDTILSFDDLIKTN